MGGTSSDVGFQIVQEAPTHLGVPYKLGGKSRAGLDCSGLVWLVHQNVGCEYSYRSTSHFRALNEFEEVGAPEDGDVVLFNGHMGIYDGGMLISAQSGAGRVSKGQIGWFGAVVGYFRWK